jgi:nicotinate-nucleotide--dimethylbenzimidazole phosphoribosyltransferase
MTVLEKTCSSISWVDEAVARQTQKRLDAKTKPRRSLGALEDLACRLAAAYGTSEPPLPTKAVVVMAADHGVVEEVVSAYPSEVTGQMVKNFAAGGAAINVLARQAGAQVLVVDMGTKSPDREASGVRNHRLGQGTANFSRGPAMNTETARRAVEIGICLATELVSAGVRLIGLGDMGIGNTTSASALTAVLTGEAAEHVTGRGTGIDEAGWRRKVEVIQRALAANQPDPADALGVLAKVGGFEIAGLVGVILGAAARRVPAVLDGFITGAAALVADRQCPQVRNYLIAAHRSAEPGHAAILRHLELRPLLDLDLRLGEGTGAVLAMNLVEAALRLLREMATFASAGVTDAGV